MSRINAIIFTGPESSGKSFLANYVSATFDLPILAEYSRTYLEKYGPTYQYEDLEIIARKHLRLEENFSGLLPVIMDTDLLTLKIWSEFKFGKCAAFILQAINNLSKDRLYLLCEPDIPWHYDPLRENRSDRQELFQIYRSTLEELQLPFKIINGDFETRMQSTHKLVDAVLKNNLRLNQKTEKQQ